MASPLFITCIYRKVSLTCTLLLPCLAIFLRQSSRACHDTCQTRRSLLWCQTGWPTWHIHYMGTRPRISYSSLHRRYSCWGLHSAQHGILQNIPASSLHVIKNTFPNRAGVANWSVLRPKPAKLCLIYVTEGTNCGITNYSVRLPEIGHSDCQMDWGV